MGQDCFARWRLSSSVVVCNAAGRRSRGRSGGRHCTAGQYGYVPLGRHLVLHLLCRVYLIHCSICSSCTNQYHALQSSYETGSQSSFFFFYVFINSPKAIAGVGFYLRLFVCLSVFPHDISKTKFHTEMYVSTMSPGNASILGSKG